MNRSRLLVLPLAALLLLLASAPASAVYHPTLGRFLQRDPIGYDGSFNLYEAVGSSPVRYVDPLGLKPPSWARDTSRLPGYDPKKDRPVRSGQPFYQTRRCYAGCVGTYYYCLSCKTVSSERAGMHLEGSAACVDCLQTCLTNCYYRRQQRYPCCMAGCDSMKRADNRQLGGGHSRDDSVGKPKSTEQGDPNSAAETGTFMTASAASTAAAELSKRLGGRGVPVLPPGLGEAAQASPGLAEGYGLGGLAKGQRENGGRIASEDYMSLPEDAFNYATWRQSQGGLGDAARDIENGGYRGKLPPW